MPFDALTDRRDRDTITSLFLERAMQRVANPRHWGRFMMQRRTWFTRTVRYCMVGAMLAEGAGELTLNNAMHILARAIDPKSRRAPLVVVMEFNDASIWEFLHGTQTRHRDVMAVWYKAIESAKVPIAG